MEEEFSEEARGQVREDLSWLAGFLRDRYGLTISKARRLIKEMATVSV